MQEVGNPLDSIEPLDGVDDIRISSNAADGTEAGCLPLDFHVKRVAHKITHLSPTLEDSVFHRILVSQFVASMLRTRLVKQCDVRSMLNESHRPSAGVH